MTNTLTRARNCLNLIGDFSTAELKNLEALRVNRLPYDSIEVMVEILSLYVESGEELFPDEEEEAIAICDVISSVRGE